MGFRSSVMLVVLLSGASTASAHHSPGMFDDKNKIELKGTVREFQWTNPHSYVQLMVKSDRGREEEWSLEMGAPMYLFRKGWRPASLKPGDVVTITIAPLRSGKHGGLVLGAVTSDGHPVGGKLQ